MKKNREAAALRLGWSIKEVLNCLKQPHVKLYAIEFRERFIKTMAQMEVAALKKTGITRSSIESRLMDLALMDPEQTKGSIDGQVKALQALGNIIGLTKDDPLERKSDEELMDLVMSAREKATGKTSPVQ